MFEKVVPLVVFAAIIGLSMLWPPFGFILIGAALLYLFFTTNAG